MDNQTKTNGVRPGKRRLCVRGVSKRFKTTRMKRKDLLKRAAEAKNFPPPVRRYIVSRLIAQSHQFEDIFEEDVFSAAYDDPEGRSYWSGWFADDKSSLLEFAKMLAGHNAKAAPPEIRDRKRDLYRKRDPDGSRSLERYGVDPLETELIEQILSAYEVAFRSKKPWIIAEQSFFEVNLFNSATVVGFEIMRSEAIEWISTHPDFKHLVPDLAKKVLGLGNDNPAPREENTELSAACKGGSSALYDRAGIEDFISIWLKTNKLPNQNSGVMNRLIADWFGDRGVYPSDPTIRRIKSKIYKQERNSLV